MNEGHILVVDDDDRIRTLLKKFLSKQGFSITTAADADTARQLMKTLTFSLAIIDIMMPDEDGLSLLDSMRQQGNTTPVLLLTARGL
ncbi:MAG: response regulator, partial [Henriciella sp.]